MGLLIDTIQTNLAAVRETKRLRNPWVVEAGARPGGDNASRSAAAWKRARLRACRLCVQCAVSGKGAQFFGPRRNRLEDRVVVAPGQSG